jgi:hypothetical protein
VVTAAANGNPGLDADDVVSSPERRREIVVLRSRFCFHGQADTSIDRHLSLIFAKKGQRAVLDDIRRDSTYETPGAG